MRIITVAIKHYFLWIHLLHKYNRDTWKEIQFQSVSPRTFFLVFLFLFHLLQFLSLLLSSSIHFLIFLLSLVSYTFSLLSLSLIFPLPYRPLSFFLSLLCAVHLFLYLLHFCSFIHYFHSKSPFLSANPLSLSNSSYHLSLLLLLLLFYTPPPPRTSPIPPLSLSPSSSLLSWSRKFISRRVRCARASNYQPSKWLPPHLKNSACASRPNRWLAVSIDQPSNQNASRMLYTLQNTFFTF